MLNLEYAGLSDQGPVRDNNEDCLANHTPADPALLERKGSMLVVADGVGGNRAGEVASAEAARKLIECYYANAKKPLPALRDAFKQTNLHVYDLGQANPAYRRMETTLSALVIVGNQLHIGHIGDSRIYHIHHGAIQQLTRDHSEVGELVRMQILTEEEAQNHPRRNVITRSVGSDLLTAADFRTEPVQIDDHFVLCTDGLWSALRPQEIAEVVTDAPVADACQHLVQLALARGSDDNVSVSIVNVVELALHAQALGERRGGLLRRTLQFFGNGHARQAIQWGSQ